MGRQCEVCGKSTQVGNAIETRGKAKYLGGVGTKVTGITRRTFKPNLQRIKVTEASGRTRTVRICTQCIRGGAVRKAVKRAPFKLSVQDQKALSS
jgi:large subunit ribosomal protein L28